jgi:thiamine transporter ThiT
MSLTIKKYVLHVTRYNKKVNGKRYIEIGLIPDLTLSFYRGNIQIIFRWLIFGVFFMINKTDDFLQCLDLE